jgi:hypothetical protein
MHIVRNELRKLTILVTFLVAGCGTPAEIRQSAELSVAQLSVMQSQIERFVAENSAQAERRRVRLREEFLADRRLEGQRTETLELVAFDNSKANSVYKDLMKRVTAYATADARSRAEIAAFEEELAKLTKNSNLSKEEFASLQRDLAALAADTDLSAQVAFVRDYAKCVAYHVEKNRQVEVADAVSEGSEAATTDPLEKPEHCTDATVDNN